MNGPVHNLLMQFFTLGGSKIEVFETYFSDTVITYDGHPSYVKHLLGRIYVFFTLFGYWAGGGGRSPQGLVNGAVHNLLMQFFTLGSSKIELFETYFSDTVITYNDHPRCVKQVLGRIYVFFSLFGYWVRGGGVSNGIGTQPACAIRQPKQSSKWG